MEDPSDIDDSSNWDGGFYELSMKVGPTDDTRLKHLLIAIWRLASATGPFTMPQDGRSLVHVIDGSHPRWSEQMAAVEDVLHELGAAEAPRINAINKIDRITREALRDIEAEIPGAIPISALRRVGLVNLLRTIAQRVPDPVRRVSLVIPYTEAGVLARVLSDVWQEKRKVFRLIHELARTVGELAAFDPHLNAERVIGMARDVTAEAQPRSLERLRPYMREPGNA